MQKVAVGLVLVALASCFPSASPPHLADSPRISFGTGHPIVVEAYAPDGSWIAACQAREDTDDVKGIVVSSGLHGSLFGDEMQPFFFNNNSKGEPIDAFVDADVSGRWVVLILQGTMTLRDTHSNRDFPLGTPIAQENASMTPRAATFSEDGAYLVYILDPSEKAILRSLATGSERIIDHGSGRLWVARFAGEGAFLALAIVEDDTNANGRLDLPRRSTSLADSRCRGQVASYFVGGYEGDEFVWRIQDLNGAQVPGNPVGSAEGVVVTSRDGRTLHWNPVDGQSVAVTMQPCASGYEIAAIWPPTRGVLAYCEATSSQAIHDKEGRHDLELKERPWVSTASTNRIAVPGADLVDMQTRRVFDRAYSGELAIRDARVFEETKKKSIRVRDLGDGTKRVIKIPRRKSKRYAPSWGRWLAVQHDEGGGVMVVDIDDERFVGFLPSMPVMITEDGSGALFQTPGDIPSGPIVWATPDPLGRKDKP